MCYHFPDPSVHPVAFSINHLGTVPDMMWLREMAWSVTADLFCSVAANLLVLRL